MAVKKDEIRRLKTDSALDFLFWFPELDKCPVCKKGRTIFDNFRVRKIVIEVDGVPGRKAAVFTFKRNDPETGEVL